MTSLGYYPQMILFSYKGGEGGGEFYKTQCATDGFLGEKSLLSDRFAHAVSL